MKNFTKLFALAVVILGFSATSFGQTPTVNDNFEASAVIAGGITLTNGQALSFGTIAAGTIDTKVTVDLADGRSKGTGDATLVGNDGKTGIFTVLGDVSHTYSVILPTLPVKLIGGTSGTAEMTILAADFVSTSGHTGNTVATNTSGLGVLKIGAALTILAGQQSGGYTGTYDVTINY